ncbi:MAG TPA: POTRA domain-containing protein [Burkholderiales bacterium]|nr:POTRA domain-containing protein [Burkholderiales bacterium]
MRSRGALWGLCVAALLGLQVAAFAQAPASPRFDIRRFVVEGNTLIPQQEVDAILAPFRGASRDFADVQRALEALQAAYVARGYQAVRVVIPEQELAAGEVLLRVVEAKVRDVRVEGNRYFDAADVRASIPAVKEGEAPNTRRIAQNVQLANENPAKQTAVTLASTPEPGKVDVALKVTDQKPSKVSAFLDNSGTSETGYYRAGIGYQNANVNGTDQVFTTQFITSPGNPNNVKIAGLGYRVPLYAYSGMVDAYAGYSDVNSGTLQDLFAVTGSGTIFGGRYTQQLTRLGAYEQKLSLGADYRDFHQNVELIGTSGTLLPDVTIHPVTLAYFGRLSRVGSDLSLSLAYSQNVPGGQDGDQAAFSAQRAGAQASYSLWRFGAAYTHALGGGMLARAALNGQASGDVLIAAEQFGMGGRDSVRGFLERETANDNGYSATLELYSPDFGTRVRGDWRVRGLVFTDWARGHDNAPIRLPDNGLGSVGVGLRMGQGRGLSLRADWAYVTDGAGLRATGSNRLDFLLGYVF